MFKIAKEQIGKNLSSDNLTNEEERLIQYVKNYVAEHQSDKDVSEMIAEMKENLQLNPLSTVNQSGWKVKSTSDLELAENTLSCFVINVRPIME